MTESSQTQPRHGWMEEVALKTIEKVKDGPTISTGDNHGDLVADWLRDETQRTRLNAAYNAGESPWMIADEMVLRWYAHRRDLRDTSDDRIISAAHRASMNVPLASGETPAQARRRGRL